MRLDERVRLTGRTGLRFRAGFSLIEIMVGVAILAGLVAMVAVNSFNSQYVRALDNTASEVLMALQTAKWQAASSRMDHRVRFSQSDGAWSYVIEREAAAGSWTQMPGLRPVKIPSKITAAINLPTGSAIAFQPTGIVTAYDSSKNSIVLSSAKLSSLGQPSNRTIRFLAGGSVQFSRS